MSAFRLLLRWSFPVLAGIGFPACAGNLTGGAQAFQRCAACHLSTGKGVPGLAPGLRNRLAAVVTTQRGRDYLVLVVDRGLVGSLRADGLVFNGAMPPHGAQLGEAGVAAVLNHVLTSFDQAEKIKGWHPFTASEVLVVRKQYPGATAVSVYAMRKSIKVLAEAR